MKRDDGFTLLEVLVALSILMLSLITLYRAVGGAYSGWRRVALQDEALTVGQSQLVRIGNDLRIKPAVFRGRLTSGSPWQIVVEDITPSGEARLFRHYSVIYDARDPSGGPLLQLRTFRITREDR